VRGGAGEGSGWWEASGVAGTAAAEGHLGGGGGVGLGEAEGHIRCIGGGGGDGCVGRWMWW